MTIDVNKKYFAKVDMEKGGSFTIQLYPDKAPITVNNFVFLAEQGFYDGVTFHRVLDGFMAQGGDPTGTGGGGPGYEFQNEDSDLTFDKAGVVAMANAGRDTNGSQFFITFVPMPQLNGGYTIFGQVIDGMDVVNGITRRDPNQNPTFTGDVIKTITITEE
jgi:cyclophilin family peptidyl-prolyl cis-trans isomerase